MLSFQIADFLNQNADVMPFIYIGIFVAVFFLGFLFAAALRKARNYFAQKFSKKQSYEKEKVNYPPLKYRAC